MNRTLSTAVVITLAASVACTSGNPAGATNEPIFAASADLNGDGRRDVVAVDPGSKQLKVLLNRGDGTFAAASALAAQPGPNSAVIADLDADGHADLVVADYDDSNVAVYL